MDMVKPIPAIKAMPKICLKLTPEGNSVILNFTLKYEKSATPANFPANKPVATLIIKAKSKSLSGLMEMPALAKAKSGSIK